MNFKKLLLFLMVPIFLIKGALAHCPLCTAGAAVAAGGAIWLGVSPVIVSLFIGAFAVSMGWWFARLIKKRYIPFQRTLIIILSFALTVIPILPIISLPAPFFVSLMGGYGSLLNRTYMIDLSLVGSFVGGLIVLISPGVSNKITKLRNEKHIPYQRMLTTFLLLLIAGGITQLLL